MSKADIEFYESKLVLDMAKIISRAIDSEEWDDLSSLSKNRYLDASVNVIYDMLNYNLETILKYRKQDELVN